MIDHLGRLSLGWRRVCVWEPKRVTCGRAPGKQVPRNTRGPCFLPQITGDRTRAPVTPGCMPSDGLCAPTAEFRHTSLGALRPPPPPILRHPRTLPHTPDTASLRVTLSPASPSPLSRPGCCRCCVAHIRVAGHVTHSLSDVTHIELPGPDFDVGTLTADSCNGPGRISKGV